MIVQANMGIVPTWDTHAAMLKVCDGQEADVAALLAPG